MQEQTDQEGSRMTIRLTVLGVHPPATSADAIFGHAPLSEYDLHETGAALAALPPQSSTTRSPSTRCALTAAFLGLKATAEPALRDIDYGTWRGRTPAEIVAADPHGYSAWLTDPDAAPHGGETVRQLCQRTANWLSSLPPETGRALAIVEPAVVQALLVHALSAPARAFWKLEVPPHYTVCLTRRDGVWSSTWTAAPYCPRTRASGAGQPRTGQTGAVRADTPQEDGRHRPDYRIDLALRSSGRFKALFDRR
ncbi:histidine phosphatase family protein [Streptomyces sp. HC307]|uniref:histidine phosphatase family protein n=1 Tax=Streptomyces flavusporus TaxID=3385496 RepID=UPI00391718B2